MSTLFITYMDYQFNIDTDCSYVQALNMDDLSSEAKKAISASLEIAKNQLNPQDGTEFMAGMSLIISQWWQR